MAAQQITQGVLEAIFTDPARAQRDFSVSVLQCLQVKQLDSKPGAQGQGQERYRLVLSDIKSYVQCMLATQLNHLVHDGLLQRGAIIRMTSHQAQHLKGRSVLIVLALEVLTEFGTPEKIGDPKGIDTSTVQAPANTTMSGPAFYGAKAETQDSKTQVQKQIARGGAGGGGGGGGGTHGATTINPIESLSMYSHKWTIKARVTAKSDMKTWAKPSGEGKLFNVTLLDESGEIRATAFNEQADQYWDVLNEGMVYYISSPCKVQMAKKQFNNTNNDYELVFERDTHVEKCEDQTNVPQIRYNFVNIQELQDVEKDATVDVIGVLKEVQEVTQIVSKTTQKPFDKRELVLVDDTGFQVRATIWGKTAMAFDAPAESIVAFKGMRVGDFGGRSLSLLSSGSMSVDPDVPEAHRLKGWYDASGRNDNFASHNNMTGMGGSGRKEDLKCIAQVKAENLGFEQTEYFTVKATIVHIKQDNFSYPACESEGCNKKVVDNGDGTWRCEKCDMNRDKPKYRYVMSCSVNDHTGQMWISMFDDTARIIMNGKTADELIAMREEDDALIAAQFDAANCRKYAFRIRAKMDTFGDQARVRYQCMSATPLDYKSEANKLVEMIRQMSV
ncbi:replication factor-A protein 1 [Podospora conica]|nr:replication factor-A protein 1 [Schizothecium conicum]